MGAGDTDFGADACFAQEDLSGAEDGPVGATAHDDADEGAWVLQESEL